MNFDIELYPPVALYEIGGRPKNEDAIYPNLGQAGFQNQLFIVCDGVGGANCGEIASDLVCQYYAEYFFSHLEETHHHAYIEKAIEYTEERLTEYLAHHPQCKGMATTLSSISIHQQGVTIVWIGDSRVYHVRDGHILYQTKDHSLVNLLIKQGEISEKEALVHPKRNVILKAIQSAENPAKPESYFIDDIQADDYFLLCTDGLLENINDKIIQEYLVAFSTPESIKNTFLQLALGKTMDNFSMYLIKVKRTCENFQKYPTLK